MIRYLDPLTMATEVRKVTRKPGEAFSCYVHPLEGFCVRVEFTVPDSYHHGRMQTQGVNIPVPPIVSVEHFHDWLEWRMRIIDAHEHAEFYKVDGVMRHDPHSDAYWKQACEDLA